MPRSLAEGHVSRGDLRGLWKFPAQSVCKDHSYYCLDGELEAEDAATGDIEGICIQCGV